MSSRVGALLYAAVLVVVLGAGCAVPRGVPTSVTAPPVSTASVSRTSSSSASSAAVSPAPATSARTTGPTSVPPTSALTTVRPSTATVTTSATRTTTTAKGCALPATLLGKDLTVVSATDKVVALTFDAGANADGVASILATLDARDATGTFFLTGAFVESFPGASRQIASAYPIGNHTQHHPDLTTLSADAVRAEIRTGAASIVAATGVDPRPYFRFPYGAVTTSTISIVNAECYVPFRWTVDTWGWKGTAGDMSADAVLQRVLDGLRPGAIVLMHVGSNPDDGSTFDADALPAVIDAVRAQGYRLVTLEYVLPATP